MRAGVYFRKRRRYFFRRMASVVAGMAPFSSTKTTLASIARYVSELATGGRRPHTGHGVGTTMEGRSNGLCTTASESACANSTQPRSMVDKHASVQSNE